MFELPFFFLHCKLHFSHKLHFVLIFCFLPSCTHTWHRHTHTHTWVCVVRTWDCIVIAIELRILYGLKLHHAKRPCMRRKGKVKGNWHWSLTSVLFCLYGIRIGIAGHGTKCVIHLFMAKKRDSEICVALLQCRTNIKADNIISSSFFPLMRDVNDYKSSFNLPFFVVAIVQKKLVSPSHFRYRKHAVINGIFIVIFCFYCQLHWTSHGFIITIIIIQCWHNSQTNNSVFPFVIINDNV